MKIVVVMVERREGGGRTEEGGKKRRGKNEITGRGEKKMETKRRTGKEKKILKHEVEEK